MRLVARLLSFLIGITAIFFAARAAFLLHSIWSVQNYMPASRGADGCPVCPVQTFLDIETQQILIILAALATFGVAWMMWRKA